MKFIYALLYAVFNGKQQLPVYNISNQKKYSAKLFLPIGLMLVLAVSLPQIGFAQIDQFKTGGNMLTSANYSGGIPDSAQDVLLTTPNDSLYISTATALAMQSLNITNGNTYYIGDSSASKKGSLKIGNSAGVDNKVSEISANDIFYLANNSTLTIKPSIYSGTDALTLTLASGGNFDIQSGSTLSISAILAGASQPIAINGGGTVNLLNGSSTNIGAITINSGVCSIVNGFLTAASTVVLNGGSLQANGGAVTTVAANSITLGGGVIDNNNNTFTLKGGLSGTDLTSIGTGELLLSMTAASTTYTGNTYIYNGTLGTSVADVLPSTTVVYLGQASSANVGSLDLDAKNQSIAGLVSVTGTNSTSFINNTVISSAGGAPVITINGSGTYTFGNNTPQNSGVISGPVGLNMSGTGLQILGGVNTYSGVTTFSNGELRFVLPSGSSQSLGTATFSGGTLGTTGSAAGSSLTFSTINLTLGDSSTISLDPSAVHTVTFSAKGTFGTGTQLTITGWQGSYNGTTGTAGKIIIGSTLTAANLLLIQFINPSNGGTYAATQLGTGEIVPVAAPAITIGAISGSPFCQGASATVNFTYTPSSTFTSGSTTFTAYLSSATGSFASPTTLQSVTSNASGSQSITVTIPATAVLGTAYRIEIRSSGAVVLTGTENTNKLTITANNWTGETSTDWNTASNWCSGVVPVSGSSVVVPGSLTNYPNITATSYVNNLTINIGGSVTVASGGTLSIYGTITDTSSSLTAAAGTIQMSGSLAQAIGGSLFASSTINNLIDSNTNTTTGLSINSGDPVSITGQLSFGDSTAKLTTNNGLVLVSTASTTASVGQIAENSGTGVALATINGNVTVQRYYPAHRRWRLVTASVQSSGAPTISASWQEGGQSIAGSVSNPNPGFGTHITGPGGAFVASTGYDQSPTNSPSIGHLMAANNWYTIANTTSTLVTAYQGYMLFVRGDRSYPIYTTTSSTPATSTILRTTGVLNTGKVTVPVNSGFTIIGNPYAATINFNNVYNQGSTSGALTSNSFSIWDPNIASVNNIATSGTGGWMTLSWNGSSYDVAPYPQSFDNVDINGDIQSGAAFAVNGTGSGSVEIDEADKVSDGSDGNVALFRPSVSVTAPLATLRTTLYATDTAHVQTYLADGVLNEFGSSYSDSLDWSKDVQKLFNLTERISILKSSQNLSIERSALPEAGDTVYLSVAGLQQSPYQLVIGTTNFARPDIKAFLVDAFDSTSTPILLGDTSVNVNFTVTTVPGSYAANRFSIVFTATPPATVTYSNVTATAVQNKNIAVQWQVTNQTNTKDYVVEKSTDGTHFTVVDTTAATPTDVSSYTYNWTDTNAVVGTNYYRIYTIGDNLVIQDTSNVASAVIDAGIITPVAIAVSLIKVYPNPVTNGTVNVDLTNLPAGNYGIKIISTTGDVLLSETTYHGLNAGPITIPFGQGVSAGVYILEIIDTNGNKTKVTFENQ